MISGDIEDDLSKTYSKLFQNIENQKAIKKALGDAQTTIDDEYQDELKRIEARVNNVVNTTAKEEYRSFLQTDLAKSFLADYDDQFKITPGKNMEQYLKDGHTILPNGREVSVEGEFGVSDLVRFYFNTEHA